MPEQIWIGNGRWKSGKEVPGMHFKLVNFRGDPDDPEDVKRALALVNKHTPASLTVSPEGFMLVHDNPAKSLETKGVEDLVKRPVQMSTETIKTQPMKGRPTDAA